MLGSLFVLQSGLVRFERPPESVGTSGRESLSWHNSLEPRSLTPLPPPRAHPPQTAAAAEMGSGRGGKSCRARWTARRSRLGLREVSQDRVHDIVVDDERDDPHLATTRRAQLPRLARKGEQVLLSAIRTPDPGEAVLKETAVEIPPHLLLDEAAPEPAAALEALLPLPPHLFEVRLEEPVKGRRAGISGPVAGRAALSHSDARRLLQRGRAASA